jgi:RNA polymerase sigma-70 factor (ECF subfamily)
MENENQIISECISGNWENFDRVYDYYLPKIYQFVYNRMRHKQTAEDLTSVIFLKVVRNLNSYRQGDAIFAAWIYKIARNTLIDYFRSHKTTQDLETAFDLASKDDVVGAVDTVIKLEAVRSALKNLSEPQREILTMRVWEGLSHAEIAEIMEISESSSKVTFSRAVANLKQTMETI